MIDSDIRAVLASFLDALDRQNAALERIADRLDSWENEGQVDVLVTTRKERGY